MKPLIRVAIGLMSLLLLLPAQGQAQKEKARFKPVFTNMTEFGASFGQFRYNINFVSENVGKRQNITAQTFNGVQLRPKLAVGGTVGVDWYTAALITPVCAGLRYDLAQPGKKNLRVFTSLDTGYGFTWLHEDPTGYETRGGWVISPGIGFRIGRPQNANFIMSLSYRRQEAEVEKPLSWNEFYKHEVRVYNRVALRLGVSF